MAKIEYNRALKCNDCKYSQGSLFARLTRATYSMSCTLPEAWREEEYDPVFGKVTPCYFKGCSVMRGEYHECGPDAKKWVPRDSKLIFLALRNQ